MEIDLNADLGEGCGSDEALLDLVSSANIACGWHAGGARLGLKRQGILLRQINCQVHGFVSSD